MGYVAAWWYYGMSAYMIGMIVWLLLKNNRLEQQVSEQEQVTHKWFTKHAATFREANRWKTVAEDTDVAAISVVNAVLPLVEKTDWMTGRWGGRFNQLVAMENRRNEKVDQVRAAIGDIPMVKDLNKADLFRPIGGVVAQGVMAEPFNPKGLTQ